MTTPEDVARAQRVADRICYADQREWSGLLTIDRFKLREVMAERFAALLAEARAEEREACVGHVEYAVNNRALREKLVARIREGNAQHTNRALSAEGGKE